MYAVDVFCLLCLCFLFIVLWYKDWKSFKVENCAVSNVAYSKELMHHYAYVTSLDFLNSQ